MSTQKHGWPVEAIRALARAERLRKTMHGSMQAVAAESPEIKALERQIEELKTQIGKLNDQILGLKLKSNTEHRTNLQHIQQEIETLTRTAKDLKQAVPAWINELLEFICSGVDWSAGFQVVWWNEQFVIMRLPGRKFWSARSQAYAKAETRMYSRKKFEEYKTKGRSRGDGFAATDCERNCRIKSYEGKIEIHVLKDWKEEADYATIK